MARVPGVAPPVELRAGRRVAWRKVSASSRARCHNLTRRSTRRVAPRRASPTVTYEEVCGGATGLAEAVRVRYDPRVVRFAILAELFSATLGQELPRQALETTPFMRRDRVVPSAFFMKAALDHDGTEDRSATALRKAILSAAAQLGCKADDIAVEVVTGERKRTAVRATCSFWPKTTTSATSPRIERR